MLHFTCILVFSLLISLSPLIRATFNLTLPHQHPNPDALAQEVHRRILTSTANAESKSQKSCLTGNPIDDCWRCDPNWANNRQRLAECAIGFGRGAAGGRGGQIYVVTDSSDNDVANPTPGTLRHAVIQTEPLWIIFSANMQIKLKHELIVNSFKTIDGRGANVYITGGGCITLQYVSNVIIHNIHIYNCVSTGNTNIRSSPTHVGYRGKSDGDGITIFGSRNIWVDHCALSHCTDGLVDATMGSTAITISNNYFSHHNEVMLMGHDDRYLPDTGMQVTIAFNYFGQGLIQRMPRCRHGYFHVVNNDFTEWKMYAIGGSANPTINSQGNRYIAPSDPDAKEVTKRVDTNDGDWDGWNWRTVGDVLVNGAYFVPSGQGLGTQYTKAFSVEPKSAAMIDQLTMTAGVLGGPRSNNLLACGIWGYIDSRGHAPFKNLDDQRRPCSNWMVCSDPFPVLFFSFECFQDNGDRISYGGGTTTGANSGGGSNGNGDDFFGMVFGSRAPSSPSPTTTSILLSFLVILVLNISISNDALLSLPLLLL